ncbi:TrmH family RNA methyltransferase [Halanaerobium saccharolyticum]|uniref:TrmH family RNA methyltransferase n=1 Tax=Halanaerobium saccharolyticum TaxID=43595 RepID=A0A4R6LER8_9FIRM|nr:TrmH family RNA methyltransferase [Halanaerobium saccharolyticum]TDO73410.1 TrmH family RNA methyltransferase [Halanaerobium saccharolyticum]
MIKRIEKLKNPLVQEARKLSRSKNRKKNNKIQLRGLEQLNWAKDSGLQIKSIFISKNEVPDKYKGFSAPIYQTSNGILKKITETNYLISCVGVAEASSNYFNDDFVLLLDDVKDHGNIGTIIRTGKAYGINNYITTNKDFDPFFPKTIDASRGTSFKVNYKSYENAKKAVSDLKKNGYQVVATSPHGKSLQSMVNLNKKPIALVVGNESTGISNDVIEQADHIVQIPMYTEVESLNVGVATGISIYELRLKEALLMLSEKILDTIGREINVSSQLIKKAFNIKISESKITNLTGDQIIFLMVLKRESQINRGQVEKQFGYYDDHFKEFITPLYKDKFIKNKYDEIEITEKGEELLAKLWPVIEKVENVILKGFTEKEKQHFKNYLDRIKNNCLRIMEYQA